MTTFSPSIRKNFSPNPQVQSQIDWLLSLGLPPIPIQPAPQNKKPPSYLDASGQVCYFNPKYGEPDFSELLDRDPTEEELARWFQHPSTGIGTISGRADVWWVDVDSKHFTAARDCAIATSKWWNQREGYIEKTGSGGFHVPVRCPTPPPFYGFAFSKNGDRVGELLPAGTFVVLAPSLHKSGKRYKVKKRGNPIEISDWSELGLYPAKNEPLPQGFVRPTFEPQKPNFEPFQQVSDFDLSVDILDRLPPELADETLIWLKVGGALWSLQDPRALGLWENWSRQSPKFKEGECRKRWSRFKFGHFGTLVNLGRQHGWQHPQKEFSSEKLKEYRDRLDFENWKALRRFTPDKDITPRDGSIYVDGGAIGAISVIEGGAAVRAGLGTGKTQSQGHIRDLDGNRGSRSIGSRNSLELQSSERLSQNGRTHCHVRFDDAYLFLRDPKSHLHGAADTMLVAGTPEDAEDLNIFCDEVSQLLDHIVGGETLGRNQALAMKNFELMTQTSHQTFLFDGNLKDYEVQLIEKVSGRKIPKLEHRPRPSSKNFFFVDGTEVDLSDEKLLNRFSGNKTELEEWAKNSASRADKGAMFSLLLDEKTRPFIVTDSLNNAHALEKMLKESGKDKVYCLTSETQNEVWAVEFLKNPSDWIKKNRPQAFIGSPTIQSGLDIHAIVDESWTDIANDYLGQSWFSAGFAFFAGVLLVDGAVQIVNRLRDPNVPWYISCPDRALPKPQYFPRSYDPKEVGKQAEAYISLNVSMVAESSRGLEEYETIQRLVKEFKERSDNDPWWEFFCKRTAQENYERDRFRKCLEWKLKQDGHNVDRVLEFKADQLKKGFKDAKRERLDEVALEIVEQPVRTEREIELIRRKDNQTKDDIRAQERFYLESKLPGIGQSERWGQSVVVGIDKTGNEIIKHLNFKDFTAEYFVKQSDKLSCLERFWMLQNIDTAQKRSDKRWLSYLNNNLGREFKGRFLGNPYLTIWALENLEITRLLDGEHDATSEVFQDIYERGKSDPEIKIALGFAPAEPGKTKKNGLSKVTTEYVKRIADLAGIPLKAHRKRVEGKPIQTYKVDAQKMQDPYRLEALERIEQRWTKWNLDNQIIEWERLLEESIVESVPPENIEMPAEEWEILEEEKISRYGYEKQINQLVESEEIDDDALFEQIFGSADRTSEAAIVDVEKLEITHEMLDMVVIGRPETVDAAIALSERDATGSEKTAVAAPLPIEDYRIDHECYFWNGINKWVKAVVTASIWVTNGTHVVVKDEAGVRWKIVDPSWLAPA